MTRIDRQLDDRKTMLRRLEGIAECVILTVIYYYVWKYFYRSDNMPYYGRGKYVLAGVYFMLLLLIFRMCEGFKFGHLKLSDVYISQIIALIPVNFITYLQNSLIANVMVKAMPMVMLTGIDLVIAFAACWYFTAMYHGHYVPRNMILIYGKDSAVDLKFKMDMRQDKYTITEIMRYDAVQKALEEEILKHDSVILNDVPARERNDLLKFCYHNEIRTYVVPKITDVILRGASDINLFDTPLILVKGRGLSLTEAAMKRAMDIALCIILAIPFAILLGIIAIAIKLDDGGTVFFTQDRVTRDGRIFKIYKIRSMSPHKEEESFTKAVTDDDRITRVGAFIRRFRLDEIGQFINIVKGDMSFVGPRALAAKEVDELIQVIPEYSERNKVKAGLTGYAQVYGKYNTSAYDKLRMDLMYIENYSVFLDIKLILMTIRTLFHSESIEGEDKAEELKARRREVIEKSRRRE